MVGKDAGKWDAIYREQPPLPPEPAAVLKEHVHLLPDSGEALDIASGRGGNALFLARQGLRTVAWDISVEAIDALEVTAAKHQLPIEACVRDVISHPPEPESMDIVIVSRFLVRSLFPALCNSLRQNGLLFYQTFIREQASDHGPSNEDYRLAENELLYLCQPLHIIFYREEGTVGDISRGFRDQAMLIGQRRTLK